MWQAQAVDTHYIKFLDRKDDESQENYLTFAHSFQKKPVKHEKLDVANRVLHIIDHFFTVSGAIY